MKIVDRGLQHFILCELRDVYPRSVDYSKRYLDDDGEHKKLIANLVYLQSHGLISKGR